MATVDASAYANIGAAMAACATGDRLYVPSGSYTAPSGGLVITGPFEIDMEPNAIISAFSTSNPVIDIQIPADGITDRIWIHGGKLSGGASSAVSGGYGIKCVLPTTTSASTATVLRNLVIENIGIDACADVGIYLKGNNATNSNANNNFEFPVIRNVMVENGYSKGIFWQDGGHLSSGPAFGGIMDTVFMVGNTDWGSVMQTSQCVFINCYWEHNCTVSTNSGQCYVSTGDYVFISPKIEDFANSTIASGSAIGIKAQNSGLAIWGGAYGNGTEDTSHTERCAVYADASSGPCHVVIGPGRVTNVTRLYELSGVTKAEVYEAFVVSGGSPTYVLPTGMHLKRWN